MAPKKKKGKVSKEDKERLKKEEEEHRQKEDEEARLLTEQEELRRLEKEQQEEEERLKLELKDSERRGDELDEVRRLLEERQHAVTKWEEELQASMKWEHYMHCDGSPDPTVLQEINTFISLWIEDPKVQIGPVLEDCTLALKLVGELEDLLSDRPQSPESQRAAQKNQETLQCLQRLIQLKHDLATEEILKHSSSNMDIETGNMQMVIRDANVTLCLWANLSKNPRCKGYHFEEVGLEFELPKQLATCDVAVRILHTHYDHLTPLSLKARTTKHESTVSFAESHTLIPVQPESGEGETEAEGDAEDGTERVNEDTHSVTTEAVKSAISMEPDKEDNKSEEKQDSVKEDSTTDTLEEETAPEGALPAGEQKLGGSKEPLMDTTDAYVVDLDQFTPLGGVFLFHAFQLPPQAKLINTWEIRELLDSGLQVFHYPVSQSQFCSSSGTLDDEGVALTSQPVGVTITVPNCVTFLEDPQVARWDETGCQWRRDFISNVTYDKSSETLSFQMNSFYTFTLIQETYINMPFQSWELRPLGQDTALLTVIAAVTEVTIKIKDHQCMLTSIQGADLPHVTGRWMQPSALQRAMSSSGVNIFVKQHTEKYVSINAKEPSLEQMAYEQMALTSSAVAFSWSRWNSNCGRDQLVVQACEQLQEGPVPEEAWSLYLVGVQRSQRLQITEQSDHFSTNLLKGSEFHATFLHMLRDGMSDEADVRIRDSSHLFVDCVVRLLQATRVLTYS